MTRTRIGAGLSSQPEGPKALRSALDPALARLRASADLLLVFISPQFESEQKEMLEVIADRAPGAVVLGCSAGGVIGGSEEVEDAPGVAVWAAKLPEGGSVRPFRLTYETDGDHAIIDGLEEVPSPAERPVIVLFADGYSFPADLLLEHLNEHAPGVPVVGGMASAGLEAGRNALYLDDEVLRDGAVGAILTGLDATAFVSQGCRPVGETFAVTRSERNVILELGGSPAMRRIEEMFGAAGERDQLLMRRGLHVGQAIDELKPVQGRGDFLVRNVVGIDPDSGAIAIADAVEPGQTVQFQVRDAESARDDLRLVLERDRDANGDGVSGVLLFSCNGRGQALFGEPGHDVGAVRRTYGDVPVAGFFAAGEFGPVGARNFIHGFTASMLVVRQGR